MIQPNDTKGNLSGVSSGGLSAIAPQATVEASAKTESLTKTDLSPVVPIVTRFGTKGDGQLLAQFIQNHDERAFEELVKRHAGMVMAVCRRGLMDARDAEEAFQNVFLALLRKAGKFLQAKSIGGWLYKAAVLETLKMRTARHAQAGQIAEYKDMATMPQTDQSIAEAWSAMKGVLDEELVWLNEKYRVPLILCYLEGRVAEEAAADLGLKYKTFNTRLMRGREILRDRLIRRGVKVSVGVLAATLLEQVTQSAEVVSEVLIKSTVKAAVAQLALIGAGAGTVGAIMQLLKGALVAMTTKTSAMIIGGLFLAGALVSIPFLMQPSKQKVAQSFDHKADAVVQLSGINQDSAKARAQTPTAKTALSPQTNENINPAALKEVPTTATNSFPFASLLDFQKVFLKAMALSSPAERWQAWREMGINLSDEDFTRAETIGNDSWDKAKICLTKLPEESLRRSSENKTFPEERIKYYLFQSAIFKVWFEKDPVSIANWSCQFGKLTSQGHFWGFYAEMDMSFNNGQYECKLSPMASNPSHKAYGLSQLIAHKWAVLDPQAAKAWADNLADGPERNKIISAIDSGEKMHMALMNQNPEEALSFAVSQYPLDYKNAGDKDKEEYWICAAEVEAIALRWLQTDPEAASAWLDQHRNNLLMMMPMASCFQKWASIDIKSASAYMMHEFNNPKHFQEGSLMMMNMVMILMAWVNQDPAGAKTWLEQQQNRTDLTDNQKEFAQQLRMLMK
jgi:RNA polymerase sigma factor (sigma-70 family)